MNHGDLFIQRHLPQQMIHARVARHPGTLCAHNRQIHRKTAKNNRQPAKQSLPTHSRQPSQFSRAKNRPFLMQNNFTLGIYCILGPYF
jgi:hypothetical protein